MQIIKCMNCKSDDTHLLISEDVANRKCKIRIKCYTCGFDKTSECSLDYMELCNTFNAIDLLYENVIINDLTL